jgi:hypothetical protein
VNHSSASRIQIFVQVYEHFVLPVCLSWDMGCIFYRIG